MCLDRITETISTPTDHVEDAWKIFQMDLGGNLYTLFNRVHIPWDGWVRDENMRPINTKRLTYPPGWHVGKSKEAASGWLLPLNLYDVSLPVKVRYVHTRGTQCDYEMMVAEEIFVPSPKDSKTYPLGQFMGQPSK